MNKVKNENYVNIGKVNISLVYCIIMFMVFVLLGVVAFGILVTGEVDKDNSLDQFQTIIQYLLFILLLVFSIFMVRNAFKKLMLIGYTTSFSMQFDKSKSGIIEVSKISLSMVQDERTIIKYFSEALKYGYLKNCRYERKDDINYIVLNKAIFNQSINENDDLKEIVLKDVEEYNLLEEFTCPSCGAKIKINGRDNVICTYCRTRYTFKREVDKKIKKASN